jgi:cytochrome c peroxidase
MQTFRIKPSYWQILLVLAMFQASFASADAPVPIRTLKGVTVPTPPNLSQYVANVTMAKVLGKALFWDMAVGSDGVQACASCHFHAGADNRAKNQLDPALLHQTAALRNVFNPTRSGNAGGPNYTVRQADFPFHVLSNPLDRNSTIVFDTNDIMSSQGVYPSTYPPDTHGSFLPIPGAASDDCRITPDGIFQVGGNSTRRVEPRNTPTTINAIFNFRNFWDGRANNRFNGGSPFGDRDPAPFVYLADGPQGSAATPRKVSIANASLASQAVGPPGNPFEMSCAGRDLPGIAKRLLSRNALLGQAVSSTDSLLAPYRAGTGLTLTYRQLIQQAFQPQYWNSGFCINYRNYCFMQDEMNFALFFGLAVQLYESTLVSDNAPIDLYLNSSGAVADSTKLTQQEKDGFAVFVGKGKCVNCHGGPQLTNAGTPNYQDAQEGKLISRMLIAEGSRTANYDEGFYNIGVRPTIEDLGVGGKDPFGNPLSFTRQYKANIFKDPFSVLNCGDLACLPSSPTAVDGAFKVPTLRNVELTGPFFHTGSRKTLEEVVEFYNRGGDRRGPTSGDTTGFNNSAPGFTLAQLPAENNPTNLDADIQTLGLTVTEQAALVAFLKRPLTDDRVRCENAPFDHPELRIPNGHTGNNVSVTSIVVNFNWGGPPWTATIAQTDLLTIPAVGSAGRCPGSPRLPFDQTLQP